MAPYSRLNRIMSACPAGLPFALKIREVTPIREAARVIQLSRSNARNASRMPHTEPPHRSRSPLEKYAAMDCFIDFPPKK